MPVANLKQLPVTCVCGLLLGSASLAGEVDYDAIAEYETGFWQVLEMVKDKESADDAAHKLPHLPHADVAEKALHPQWWTDGNESDPMVKAYFYGSASLAEALGFPAEDSIIPSPLTPDISRQIQTDMLRSLTKPVPESRGKAEKLLEQGKGLSPDVLMPLPNEVASGINGGCGFTPESAWGITAEDFTKSQFIASQLLLYAFPVQTKAEQRMEFRGSRRFLVYTVSLLRESRKYEIEQWFDISSTGKVYPEAERLQAAKELQEHIDGMLSDLFGIWDEATAQEYAPGMQQHYDKCRQLASVCEERRSIWDIWMEQNEMPQRERIASSLMDIKAAKGYGSAGLGKLITQLELPLLP